MPTTSVPGPLTVRRTLPPGARIVHLDRARTGRAGVRVRRLLPPGASVVRVGPVGARVPRNHSSE